MPLLAAETVSESSPQHGGSRLTSLSGAVKPATAPEPGAINLRNRGETMDRSERIALGVLALVIGGIRDLHRRNARGMGSRGAVPRRARLRTAESRRCRIRRDRQGWRPRRRRDAGGKKGRRERQRGQPRVAGGRGSRRRAGVPRPRRSPRHRPRQRSGHSRTSRSAATRARRRAPSSGTRSARPWPSSPASSDSRGRTTSRPAARRRSSSTGSATRASAACGSPPRAAASG